MVVAAATGEDEEDLAAAPLAASWSVTLRPVCLLGYGAPNGSIDRAQGEVRWIWG